MKQYRCLWCGKPSFNTKSRYHLGGGSGRTLFGTKKWSECDMCGGVVDMDTKGPIGKVYIAVVIYFLIFMLVAAVLTYFSVVPASIVFTMLAVVIVGFLVNEVFGMFIYGQIGRKYRNRYKDLPVGEEFDSEHRIEYEPLTTQFEIQLDKNISLRMEYIFAVRFKAVSADKLNKHPDLFEEYEVDGAPVYLERNKSGYKMGFLHPDDYNFECLNIGAEFDVYNAAGEIISTGKIIRVLG